MEHTTGRDPLKMAPLGHSPAIHGPPWSLGNLTSMAPFPISRCSVYFWGGGD